MLESTAQKPGAHYCCDRLRTPLMTEAYNKLIPHTLPECTSLFPRDRLQLHISDSFPWLLILIHFARVVSCSLFPHCPFLSLLWALCTFQNQSLPCPCFMYFACVRVFVCPLLLLLSSHSTYQQFGVCPILSFQLILFLMIIIYLMKLI